MLHLHIVSKKYYKSNNKRCLKIWFLNITIVFCFSKQHLNFFIDSVHSKKSFLFCQTQKKIFSYFMFNCYCRYSIEDRVEREKHSRYIHNNLPIHQLVDLSSKQNSEFKDLSFAVVYRKYIAGFMIVDVQYNWVLITTYNVCEMQAT